MPYSALRKGRVSIATQEYFITFVCAGRAPLFTDLNIAQCFFQHLTIAPAIESPGWLAWVLMPDHFHGLVRLGDRNLGREIQALKGSTAYQIRRHGGVNHTVWQKAYFDRALRADEDRRAVARYIVANPLRAGLVKNLGEYPYWGSVYL